MFELGFCLRSNSKSNQSRVAGFRYLLVFFYGMCLSWLNAFSASNLLLRGYLFGGGLFRAEHAIVVWKFDETFQRTIKLFSTGKFRNRWTFLRSKRISSRHVRSVVRLYGFIVIFSSYDNNVIVWVTEACNWWVTLILHCYETVQRQFLLPAYLSFGGGILLMGPVGQNDGNNYCLLKYISLYLYCNFFCIAFEYFAI